MNKLLLLIPLLAACAPSVTSVTPETSASFGPFKQGQTWVISSVSRTEPLIPVRTIFRIEKVFPDRHTVIGKSVLASERTPIQIEYTPEDKQLLVADISPISFGATKIRTCFFDSAGADGTYQGVAAHFDPSQIKTDPEGFRTAYLTTHPKASYQETAKALVQTLASDDGGPCTLELVQ